MPLPKRCQPGNAQHQIALLIREGRRAAQQLVAGAAEVDQGSGSSKATSNSPPTDCISSDSVGLEQDFTVAGKKGMLACPFSSAAGGVATHHSPEEGSIPGGLTGTTADPTPHQSSDPICAAMLEETASSPVQGPSKCPIRYLDKHSPEEIAHYVETHKHEIPRSHEVCVARYQKSEEQIRKLDAKYGNLVSMINDLSHLHRPMLPTAEEEAEEMDKLSRLRIANWARTVSPNDPDEAKDDTADVEERENHFDRPLRDIRVGESPDKLWGLSVPPVRPGDGKDLAHSEPRPPCPSYAPNYICVDRSGSKGCQCHHNKYRFDSALPKRDEYMSEEYSQRQGKRLPTGEPSAPLKDGEQHRPMFVNLADISAEAAQKTNGAGTPQVVFNISGPVFVGYPMEQAVEFMRQLQRK